MDENEARKLYRSFTKNRRKFCDGYLTNKNGTQAYRAAYPNSKSEEAAAAAASRLLRIGKVAEYINYRIDQAADKAEINVQRILREEGRIAFSDLRQIFEGETTIPPEKLPDDIGRAISAIKINERCDSEGNKTVTYEYRLWDKGKSLERIARHLGMFAEEDKGLKDGLANLGERLARAIERSENDTKRNRN
jgi:phage terminase small subunit